MFFFKSLKSLYFFLYAGLVSAVMLVYAALASFFSFWKDYILGHTRGTIKNGRHEDGTPMPEPVEFLKKFHAIPHYILMFFIISSWNCWHFYFFIFLLVEMFVLLIRPIFNDVWILRVFVFMVFWIIFNFFADIDGEGYFILISFFAGLHNIFGVDASLLIKIFCELVEIDFAVFFLQCYFLTVTLPYFCAGLVIVLPAVSGLFLLSFGYLIGYELSGIFAACCISICFFSTCYLMFIFPPLREYFARTVNGPSSYSWNSAFNDFTGQWHLVKPRNWSYIEQQLTNLSSAAGDVNVVQILNSESMDLVLDFGNFINTSFFWAPFVFVIDSVSIIVIFVVTFISALVHLYSIVYMRNDPHKVRFFAFLSIFTFFMIILVTAGNLVMLYIGWEGVGLSSFLLISFWYTRVPAVKAALKAILINKIGDLLIILASGLITFYSKGSTLISVISFTVPERAGGVQFFGGLTVLDVIACSLVISAFVKSAQIFFHTWLADAMEGPTPVSALLHAATMVTAGVYLVIRFSALIEFSAIAKALLFFGGFYTILFSSFVACTQYDIKKIIAYSTCSQLGLMFFACGLSAYDLALFHFFNHAFFKCLLFLLAGIIIHELANEQDIRKMGGLASKMPLTFLSFTIASLSLIGFPGFSGAISKDLILHLANYSAVNFISTDLKCSLLLFFSNIMIYLTMAYSFRLIYYVFLAPSNYRHAYLKKNYVDVAFRENIYTIIILLLSIMSIFSGRLFKNFFVLTDFNYISIHKEILILNKNNRDFLFDKDWKFIAFFLTLHSLALSIYFINFVRSNRKKIVWYLAHDYKLFYVFKFFNRKCYFDDMYNIFIARPLIKLSFIYNRAIEDGCFRAFVYFIYYLLKLPSLSRILTRKHYTLDHLYVVTFSFFLVIVFAFFS